MKNKKHFNNIEAGIARKLYQCGIPLTIYQVAKEVGISYPTAKDYLEKLTKRGVTIEFIFELKKRDNVKKRVPKYYRFSEGLFRKEIMKVNKR